MDNGKRKRIGFSAIYAIIVIAGILLFQQLIFRPLVVRWTEVPYSRFSEELEAGNIADADRGAAGD